MRCGNSELKNCLTGLAFTKEAIEQLKNFSMAQQALSKELVLAQPLGICKITTYVDPKLNFRNLDLTYVVGRNTTRTVTILTNDELKETLCTKNLKEMNS